MDILIASTLIAFAAGMRLLPHPPNFAPVAAVALFGGYFLPRRWAIVLPFGAMLLSDAVIGFYDGRIMAAVYACLALSVFLGRWARRQGDRTVSLIGSCLAGSVVFFAITNLAVWLWSGTYPYNASGLVACYAAAVPFFRNTLAGDLFYATALFGLYAVIGFAVRNRGWLFAKRSVRA